MTTSNHMFTTQQFAERASVSPSTVSKWLRDGKIKGIKKGGKWMISADQLPAQTSPEKESTIAAPAVESKKAPAQNPADANPQNGYSLEQFSQITYLTPYGVERYLKEGRLKGARDTSGKWVVDASNLERSDIKHLVR
jgi:excisionase family DNA binding protein